MCTYRSATRHLMNTRHPSAVRKICLTAVGFYCGILSLLQAPGVGYCRFSAAAKLAFFCGTSLKLSRCNDRAFCVTDLLTPLHAAQSSFRS